MTLNYYYYDYDYDYTWVERNPIASFMKAMRIVCQLVKTHCVYRLMYIHGCSLVRVGDNICWLESRPI